MRVAFCADAQAFEAISQRLNQQRYEFPQEKIHLMTDRSQYLAGDTLWLRAWVVDAASHRPVDASAFIYVELVSPINSTEARIKLTPDDHGVFKGYIALSAEMPEGIYQLTAHTMFMRSLDKSYFFMKPIEVKAVASVRQRIVAKTWREGKSVQVTLRYEDAASGALLPFNLFTYMLSDGEIHDRQRGSGKEVRLTLRGDDALMKALPVAFDNYTKFIPLPPETTLDVSFYPEGGYLVPDVENTVTFKMQGVDQWHGEMTGRLLDDKGHELATLQAEHDGMGLVRFTPQPGVAYKAMWRDEMEQDVAFDLPAVHSDATVLHVTADEHSATITAIGPQAHDATIVLQQRGVLLGAGNGQITLPTDDEQPGVVQATLFDAQWRKLSERLFFINGTPPPAATVTLDKAAYDSREKVTVAVDLSSMAEMPGNYAVAITDDQTTTDVAGVNVLTTLLLQSELRGRINQPDYYFQPCDSAQRAERKRHLDMLMLTQGWSRYSIPSIMRGRLAQPQSPIEKSIVLTGRVLSEWKKAPVPGATVSMIIPQVGYSAQEKTDSLGQYVFNLPLLPDSVACLVIAENKKGKLQSNLEIDPEVFPQIEHQLTSAPVADDEQHHAQQAWRMEHSGDWRHILLDEVVVTAVRPYRESSERNPYVLGANTMERKGIETLEQAIGYLPGLVVLNGNVYTSGGQARDHVRIIVDGQNVSELASGDDSVMDDLLNVGLTPFDPEDKTLEVHKVKNYGNIHYVFSEIAIAEGLLPFQDVAYIDFVRSNGHGGVLVIGAKPSSQRGKKAPSQHLKVFRPLGIQEPAEFYSPRYDDGNNCGMAPGTDLRSVLYWNPSVNVDQQGRSQFDFYTNDVPGTTYTITLEGIAPDGQLIRATKQVTKQ